MARTHEADRSIDNNVQEKERLNLIRKRVDQYGEVAVKDLALFLQVTPETVRKDLETLEYDKLITRTHGGAVKYNHINKEKSYANKWQKQSNVKERIAKKQLHKFNLEKSWL